MAVTMGLGFILTIIGLVVLAVGTALKNVQLVGGGALLAIVGQMV